MPTERPPLLGEVLPTFADPLPQNSHRLFRTVETIEQSVKTFESAKCVSANATSFTENDNTNGTSMHKADAIFSLGKIGRFHHTFWVRSV
jgi:hypothetical protein